MIANVGCILCTIFVAVCLVHGMHPTRLQMNAQARELEQTIAFNVTEILEA